MGGAGAVELFTKIMLVHEDISYTCCRSPWKDPDFEWDNEQPIPSPAIEDRSQEITISQKNPKKSLSLAHILLSSSGKHEYERLFLGF